MRRSHPSLVVPLAALLLAACSEEAPEEPAAQTAPAPAGNAAGEYDDLHAAMTPRLVSLVSDVDTPVSMLQAPIDDAQPIRDRLVWATTIGACTWDTSDSGRMRRARDLARLLHADARVALSRSDHETAAEGIAAITRLTRHLGRGDDLDKLTGGAILMQFALEPAKAHAPQWTDAERSWILTEFDAIDAADPLSLAATGDPGMRQSGQRVAAELRDAIQTLDPDR